MKRLIVVLVSFGLLFVPLLAGGSIASNLSPGDAARLISERSELFLLDVRTPAEYQQARLAGARLIPIDQLAGRLAEVPRGRPVLVYCAVGSRSAQVVNYLARKGYAEVYNLDGGIYSWAGKGYPILRGRP